MQYCRLCIKIRFVRRKNSHAIYFLHVLFYLEKSRSPFDRRSSVSRGRVFRSRRQLAQIPAN